MACFLVTGAEAVVVTAVAQCIKHSKGTTKASRTEKAERLETGTNLSTWHAKLMLLAKLLWGGVFLLAFEHIWHGEVVPWFPFLTAMNDPGDTAEMLHEMATIGVTMAVIVTAVWAIILLVMNAMANRRPVGVSGTNV